jgi:hypothetical protein
VCLQRIIPSSISYALGQKVGYDFLKSRETDVLVHHAYGVRISGETPTNSWHRRWGADLWPWGLDSCIRFCRLCSRDEGLRTQCRDEKTSEIFIDIMFPCWAKFGHHIPAISELGH